jgi:hypothetical protein
VINAHPNATVSAVSGGGLGTLAAWGLGKAGIHLTAEEATALAGGLSTIALLIGREGISGIFRTIWRGSKATATK